MESTSVTASAYLSASIISLLLTATYTYHGFVRRLHCAIPIAALMTSIWLLSVTLSHQLAFFTPNLLIAIEALHYFCWILAIALALKQFTHNILPFGVKLIIGLSAAIVILAWLHCLNNFYAAGTNPELQSWTGLCLSVMGIISIEQLYRNTSYSRYMKLIAISLGLLLIFDVYLYAHTVIFNYIDRDLWQARAALSMVTLSLMCIGASTLRYDSTSPAKLNLSRPIAFYTTSISIVGGILATLALGGYYVKLYSGQWGTVIYSCALFLAIIFIAIAYTSSTIREQLSVLINKHLFLHKYDYRTEWLKLIEKLSRPLYNRTVYQQALDAVTSVFKAPAGIICIRQGDYYRPTHHQGMENDIPIIDEPIESNFCITMKEKEWVFTPGNDPLSTTTQFNEELPHWSAEITNLWFIMPLMTESHLIGFIALTQPSIDHDLSWEDLDLIKTVGRQIADFIHRHEQAEQLTESRQFDTFSKLTAFIMHDLKNLIAQQALVVENASKHKDNPAFIEDAIKTIDNSVSRMNTLLKKLQRDQPEEIINLSLRQLLVSATTVCREQQPIPTLRLPEGDLTITADIDRLTMAIIHLIQNAQEATPSDGYVDITMKIDHKIAVIEIEDSGSGMDEKFIRERLFKPFETTKSGKGMGIGVYQAREYIKHINGTLSVNSTLGEGTQFILTIPGSTDLR